VLTPSTEDTQFLSAKENLPMQEVSKQFREPLERVFHGFDVITFQTFYAYKKLTCEDYNYYSINRQF